MKKILFVFLTSLTAIGSAQIKTDSLILHYPLDGNAMDASSSGVDGTVNGAAPSQDRLYNNGKSFYFDGVNDFITIKDTSLIKMNFPFSVSMWVLVDAYSSGHITLISNCETSNVYSGFSIKYKPNGEVYAFLGDGAGASNSNQRRLESGVTLRIGEWYHLAVNFKGLNDMEFFVDGHLRSGNYAGTATNFAHTGGPGIIGRNTTPTNTYYHQGRIDDVRIYNDSLTTRDARYLMYSSNCQNYVTVYDSISVTDTLIISQPLGAPSYTTNTIKVFPNPTSSKLFIDFGNHQSIINHSISVTNSTGQVVFSQAVSSQQVVIDLTTTMTAKGVYFFNVLDGSNQIIDTRKIVIQ